MSQEFVEVLSNYFLLPFYLIALIIAVRYYKKYFDTALRYFPVLIAYTFFNELLGHLIRYSDDFAFLPDKTFANDIIYNIYDLFYYGFYFFVFWSLAKKPKHRLVIKIIAFSILGIYIINSFFQNPMQISLYYARSLTSVTLAICAVLYWFSKEEWNWGTEKYNLMFWVSLGLFIFHIIFPFLFLTGYLRSEIWYKYNFQTILRISVVIMYCFFCTGFIISRRRAFG